MTGQKAAITSTSRFCVDAVITQCMPAACTSFGCPERRRALELLAKSRHGANEELLVHGHGFKRRMLMGLFALGLRRRSAG
jgi:hypothetical protein